MAKLANKHGGDIYTDGALKGRQILDFSSNINPLGVPGKFREALDEIYKEVVRYPDYKYRKLKESIITYVKTYYGTNLDMDEIILGNGASEVLDLFISSIRSIGIIVPSFVEYEEFALKYNNKITFVPLSEDFKYNYSSIRKSLEVLDGIIIGNPNNPTGNLIDRKEFMGLLEYCEENNKKVIVDEAFIEFCDEENSLVNLAKKYSCLFIVRAFTKFFGMPGARLGYGISSNKELLRKFSNSQLPWNINTLAELALEKSYEDREYIYKSKEWIKEELPYMLTKLKDISVISRVIPTSCNFVLCELKGIDENKLYEIMLEKGVLIRKCSNFKGLNDNFVRFAIKSRELNNILLDLLREL
jgi:threonine-phosphate decarboxylase